MMDGRTVGRPRPVRESDGDGLPNGAHGNAMGRSRQYRRRLADAHDLRLRPNSHGFPPRVGGGVPSSLLARMIRIGLTIIGPRIGHDPHAGGPARLGLTPSLP